MTPGRPLRIALLCHSVNPRGGVVHALELASALAELGHRPVVHAPDPESRGFFRRTGFETVSVPAGAVAGGVTDMVLARVEDYRRHFELASARRFDVFHAQDGISGNALASLKADGLIPSFARTVHHLDSFADARLMALQSRSVTASDARLVVSGLWRAEIRARFGLDATLVGNGVDMSRFRPPPDGREGALRARFGLGPGPILLSVGGVEERKNSRRILDAIRQFRRLFDHSQLVVAGGASVLDHSGYQADFRRDLDGSGLADGAVVVTGPLDDADMPALYRIADALVFPSLREGFGLAVLEALATGLPVVAPKIAPFTEYLADDEVAWCDPTSAGSIANAAMAALAEPTRSRLSRNGATVAARHGWRPCARAHLAVYANLMEGVHA